MNSQITWSHESIPIVVLESILTASRETDFTERRSADRHPFFAQVMLEPYDRRETSISAYTREISVGGIGLLLVQRLEIASIYQVVIDEYDLRFRRFGEVLWCRPAGHGWFLSGLQFVTPDD